MANTLNWVSLALGIILIFLDTIILVRAYKERRVWKWQVFAIFCWVVYTMLVIMNISGFWKYVWGR